jgi:hypothetical protein
MIILLALLLVLLVFGLGFSAHFLWIVAVIIFSSGSSGSFSGA